MPPPLHIYDPRERMMMRVFDALVAPVGWLSRSPSPRPVRRVLLMRLERIGDLLMVLDAVRDARVAWPDAEIDLAVGRWNEPLAHLVTGVSRVDVLTAPWLARAESGDGWRAFAAKAREWRARAYDLVINFEPDARTNLLAWLSGAPARVGYSTGGGGALLTDAGLYDPGVHVAENARALVARASRVTHAHEPRPDPGSYAGPRLAVPAAAVRKARALLANAVRPVVAIHPAGGRESKQWHLDRFAAVGRAIAQARGGTIVLTGGPSDRPQVDAVLRDLQGVHVIDTCGAGDLTTLAALLADIDLLVTGDTGPMHLAAAMATPVVALFGPSNPVRYGPIDVAARVVRVDLPCSPCGQVRLPPQRCRGHVPDCMDGIAVDVVVAAALDVLDARTRSRGAAHA